MITQTNAMLLLLLIGTTANGQVENVSSGSELLKTSTVVTPPLPFSTSAQKANSTLYSQNEILIQDYQRLQVQSIQQVGGLPVGQQVSSQSNVLSADVLPLTDPAPELVVTGVLPQEVITSEDNKQIIVKTTLPITVSQATSKQFPIFATIRPESKITEKRVDLRSFSPEILWQRQILENARAVGMLVERNKLHAVTDSIYQLDIGLTLGQQFKLCPGTPFLDQPVIGVGTAFILGRQAMMTANHVFVEDLNRYAVIFGFEMVNKQGAFEGLISIKDIYYPTRLLQSDEILDVAVFELSRPLDRPVLKCKLSGRPAIYSSIYMIGHPYGLPKKVALNASVQSDGLEEYFYTSLFASQGNSGSPVFDLLTNQVIGVLVSGEVDYTWNGSCNTSSVCRIPYCKGEKVISIAAIPNIRDILVRE